MRANTLVVLLVAVIVALCVTVFASVMSLSSQSFQLSALSNRGTLPHSLTAR